MAAEEILSIHTDVLNRALKEQDYAALEGLCTGDYMLVRPDGSVLNKQEVLQDLRNAGLRFHSIELGQTEVRMCGSAVDGRKPSGQLTGRNGEPFALLTDCGVCAARAVDQPCPLSEYGPSVRRIERNAENLLAIQEKSGCHLKHTSNVIETLPLGLGHPS